MPHKPKVVVVDDDDAILDSLQGTFESAGLDVETFNTGRQFLDTCDLPQEGCILLDVRLPDFDGLEVQRRIAARPSAPPVIMITGHGDIRMAVKAMKSGAADFIEKPFTSDAILATVHRILEKDTSTDNRNEHVQLVRKRSSLLTSREREVFDQLVLGKQNKVIAHDLGISPRTIEIHRARVMEKMQANGISHLVRMALSAGLDPEAR